MDFELAKWAEIGQVSLVAGSLVTSTGMALTGVNTFRGDLVSVFAGYVLLVAGYKIIWYGRNFIEDFDHLKNISVSPEEHLMSHVSENIQNYLLIALGLVSASFGTVIFGGVINGVYGIGQIVTAGVLCFGGYMITHIGVNKFLI